MFLVEPDKLDIKRYLRGFLFIMHYSIKITGEKTATNEKQMQFVELADVANALWHKSMMSFTSWRDGPSEGSQLVFYVLCVEINKSIP